MPNPVSMKGGTCSEKDACGKQHCNIARAFTSSAKDLGEILFGLSRMDAKYIWGRKKCKFYEIHEILINSYK